MLITALIGGLCFLCSFLTLHLMVENTVIRILGCIAMTLPILSMRGRLLLAGVAAPNPVSGCPAVVRRFLSAPEQDEPPDLRSRIRVMPGRGRLEHRERHDLCRRMGSALDTPGILY